MTFTRTLGGTVAAALCLLLLAGAACPAAPKLHSRKMTPHTTGTTGALPPMTPTAVIPVAPPSAAPAPGDSLLYDGRSADAAGVRLSAWGGGSVEDSAEVSFSKGHAIKVTTLDPYQGARITFDTPADLGDVTADKTRYLSLVVRLVRSPRSISQDGNDTQGQNQGGPPPQRPMMGQMGNGMPGQMNPGQPAAPTDNTDLPVARKLHLTFTMAGGAQADLMRPLPEFSDVQDGIDQWLPVSVPLSALAVPGAAGDASLKSLTLAGDDYAVLYVGQIKLTRDATPLSCFAGDEQNVSKGQTVTLKGTAVGGASTLVYSWDFDSQDGVKDQAQGPVVTTQYPKAGDYTATLTVSDLDNLKKPATATTVIHVANQ